MRIIMVFCVCVCVCVWVCVNPYMYICIYVYRNMCVCIYIHIYTPCKHTHTYTNIYIYMYIYSKILMLYVYNCNPGEIYQRKFFIKAIYLKWSNLENKTFSCLIYDYEGNFIRPSFVLNVLFNHPNSWYNRNNNEMPIGIFQFFLNRKINIIINHYYNRNRYLLYWKNDSVWNSQTTSEEDHRV